MTEETIELCLDDPESVQQRAIRVYLASPMTSQKASRYKIVERER